VYEAKVKSSGQIVAIKLIENIQKDAYMLRKVVREVFVMRKLSCMDNNIYTTKLYDLILPDKCTTLNKANEEGFDLKELTYVFIVMEK
jgi:hypothetical protein